MALTISLLHFLKALIAFDRVVFDWDITNWISFSSIPSESTFYINKKTKKIFIKITKNANLFIFIIFFLNRFCFIIDLNICIFVCLYFIIISQRICLIIQCLIICCWILSNIFELISSSNLCSLRKIFNFSFTKNDISIWCWTFINIRFLNNK